jgi:hypothetical protein
MTSSSDAGGPHKFAVVLGRNVPVPQALNAVGHLFAALVARADEETRRAMMVTDYVDRDGVVHPVSALSLVVLQAKNGNQIRRARADAIAAGLLCTDFIESMTGGTWEEQVQRTARLSSDELEYWGLAVFGPRPAVDGVCGKFSLWRGPSAETES